MRQGILSAVCALALASCGGPERAPRQPIAGVDTPHPEDANPHDREGEVLAAPFLGGFVGELTAAYEKEQGVVAVFPALTHSPDRGHNVVNGLGEYLAKESAVALEDIGIQALAGSRLVNALRAVGFSTTLYGSPADALSLAKDLKAAYVVSGRVDQKVLDALKHEESLDIDWTCRNVKSGEVVARYRSQLSDSALSEKLMKYYRMDSEWESRIRLERREPPQLRQPPQREENR